MLPKQAFYLMRHGESEANVKGITSGFEDVALTKKGVEQVKTVALLVKELCLENIIIYSSPLKRALTTAKIVNGNAFEIVINNDLKERDFGLWEGEPWSNVLKKLQEGYEPPEGETTLQHIERAKNVFNQILDESVKGNKTPFIVAHGGSFYAFGRFYSQTRIACVDNSELYYFEPKRLKTHHSGIPWNTWALTLNIGEDKKNKIVRSVNELYSS